MTPEKTDEPKGLKRLLSIIGPGVITGAADDDPSGVATYSIAGAQLGTSLLWMAWITWPLMAVIQCMCARIGMVTGLGLAGALKKKFPKPIMILICVTLLIANVINIGADLSGMADAAKIWTGVDSHIYIVLFGVGIGWGMIRFHYAQIANVLKWLALFLFAYIITAFLVKPDWLHILKVAAIPSIPKGKAVWSMIVAILGTTISPYLFFWQAAEEVEEEKSKGRRTLAQRQGATKQEINDRALDISVGTFFSNLVMFFIILTTALTLHAHGLTHITSSKQAAEALLPLAGNLATTLYTLGIVGVGLLAIPTLAGSAAYAFAEIFHWRGSLDAKFKAAHPFYVIIILSLLCGVGIDFIGIDPISAMYWSAVLNGLLAPFLLIGVLIIARDKKIMRGQPSSLAAQAVAALTTLLMFGAMIGMFL